MKRKTKKVVSAPNKSPGPVDISIPPFHICFPVHLKYQDGRDEKDCYFKDEFDLKKYIKRCKLKVKDCTISRTKPR
jgi:hypothetical protein